MTFNKNIFLLSLFIVLSSLFLVWAFNNYLIYKTEEETKVVMDRYLNDLTKIVHKKKELVLTASVLLSKNDNIKKCLKTKNENECIKYLQKSKQSLLNTPLFDDMKIHLHYKNTKSFFRLWDLKNKDNDLLTLFRDSLKIVKGDKKPLSCIEIGRFSMLIRGISPILEENEYLGSIEAIVDFNSIVEYFNKKGIELYILMDKKYEDIVSKVKFSKEQLLKKYIVINEVNTDISFLDDIDFKFTGYLKKESFYLLYTPIYNVNKVAIGTYVLKIYPVKEHEKIGKYIVSQ